MRRYFLNIAQLVQVLRFEEIFLAAFKSSRDAIAGMGYSSKNESVPVSRVRKSLKNKSPFLLLGTAWSIAQSA